MDFFLRGLRRKKHADLVHYSTINLQVPKETFEVRIDGLWTVNRWQSSFNNKFLNNFKLLTIL